MLNFSPIKNNFKRLRNNFQSLVDYFKLTFAGNLVERTTDFTKPVLKPVLLLHGFGTTRRSVGILEERLRRDGYDVFSLNLGGFLGRFNTNGIDTLAKLVSDKIHSLLERFPHLGKIAIIGHSKGGLIGRYYVSFLGGDEHVHTLITIGTPHKGSKWAIFFAFTVIGIVARSVRQMVPYSRFMRRLARTPIPENVRTISIFSDADTVAPPDKCRLDIAEGATHIKNVELHGYSHTDYLIKRGVYEEVRKRLNA